MKQSLARRLRILATLLVVIQLSACSKSAEPTKEPAKPPEPKNQTYRMIGGQSVISLVSSDELEIREGGQNIVCKYTKQDGKLRAVVSALGTTTAKYFNMTPQGLVAEDGSLYYEPSTYEKMMAQIELNRKLLAAEQEKREAALAKAERARSILVGTWRGEDAVFVYHTNGDVVIRSNNGQIQVGNWSISEDLLTIRRNEYRIVDLGDTTYELDDNGRRSRATRIE